MLGIHIHDPNGIEDEEGSDQGFALLEIETTMQTNKTLDRVKAEFIHPDFEGVSASGYEIHCGETTLSSEQKDRCVLAIQNDKYTKIDGAYNADNNVIGTYLHGILDDAEACNAILKWAGLDTMKSVDLEQVREHQLNRLADAIEEHCDIPDI